MSHRRRRLDRRILSKPPGRAYVPALALTALGGAAALSHELIWTRRLTDLLGTSVEASARVFGCFFLGLALGSAWASLRVAGTRHPWRATAAIEAAVALLSLPILGLPEWTGWMWPAIGPEALIGPLGWTLKWLVSVLVILPPAVAMGAVLPFLAAATLGGERSFQRAGVWLYAANTLGGVVGLVATTLVALPTLGAPGSLLVAMGVNLALAAFLLWVDFRQVGLTLPPPRAQESVRPVGLSPGPAFLAFFSGAGVLAAEIMALELVMLVAPISLYGQAAVLTAVILSIGLAALIAPFLRMRATHVGSRLPGLLSGGGLVLIGSPPVFIALATVVGPLSGDATLTGFFFRLTVVTMACVGPALLLLGQVFPEAVAAATAGDRDSAGARQLGRLLAWNGIGGLVGAEGAYRLILPAFGIHGGMAVLGLLYLAAALGLTIEAYGRDGVSPILRSTGMLLCGALLAVGLVSHLPHVNPYLGLKVLDQEYGREGAVAVVEPPNGSRSILVSNQYVLGGTDARWEQERQAHLPLLLHPDPHQVAFIGLATGITPGAALEHVSVESLTIVEVSPLVVRAADRWFGEWNHGVTRRPEARVVVEDGRTFLASCTNRFDVVVGDLYLPWGPGESRLFSVEHYRGARNSLRPGGLYCQWLPAYQLTKEQLQLIVTTFGQVFPRTHLIRNDLSAGRPVIGLVGFRNSDLDWEIVAQRCAQARSGGTIRDPSARHPEAMGMLYLGALNSSENRGPWNSLANLALESDAGLQRVTGDPGRKYLHGPRFLDWCRIATSTDGNATIVGVPAAGETNVLHRLMRVGLELTSWDLSSRTASGRDGRVARTVPEGILERVPSELRSDRSADWGMWSGPDIRSPGSPLDGTRRGAGPLTQPRTSLPSTVKAR